MMRLKVFLSAVIVLALFISCKTTGIKENDAVYLMLYDQENNAVSEAEIFVDNGFSGKTDVYGRFLLFFESKEKGQKHFLTIKKDGYLKIEDEFNYESSLFLYYRTGTFMQFLAEAEKSLDEERYKKAAEEADRALLIEKRDDAFFLKVFALIKVGEKEEAKRIMDEWGDSVKKSEYFKALEEML